ncbi:MAG: metalloregulator ArsR/SmtB family transcription factor [Planctomycetota bacterium]
MAIRYQETLDRTFHALGDGTRRRMLRMLAQRGECTASELGAPVDAAQPTISKHLRVLEQAGLVSRHVSGRVHRFRLAVAPLNEASEWIAKHRRFWEHSLDALGEVLDELPTDESS